MSNNGRPLVLQSTNPPPPVHGVANVVDMILQSPSLNDRYELQYMDLRKRSGTKFSERLSLENLYYTVKQLAGLVHRLMTRCPNIFHAHVTEYWGFRKNMLFVIIAKCVGCKIVAHLHGARFDSYYDGASVFERKIIERFLNLADVVIVLSPRWKAFCGRFLNSEKIEVVPNAIRWEYMAAVGQSFPQREDRQSVNVLYVGSTGARKGVFDLVKTIPDIVARNPAVRFTIAGREEKAGEEKKLRELINQLGVAGWIKRIEPTQEEIIEVYKSADIYVLPSYADAFPVAILEAMSMGLPIISTRVGGIAEMVEEGKGAALIEPGDLEALRREILRLAAAPELRSAMGKKNWERFRSCFSPNFVSRLIGQIYDGLLNEVARTPRGSPA